MTVLRFKRADRPYQYIAARMGGAFDPLPSWFQLLEKTGTLRYDSEHNVEVCIITGAWQSVSPGEWVVLQRADTKAGPGFDKPSIWHIEHEDFIKIWEPL